MADFPTIKKPSRSMFRQQLVKAQIRSDFENGSVQTRPRHTKSRYKFILGWRGLPTADFNSLVSHFNSNLGSTFNYTHPVTSIVYVVRYTDDSLPEAQEVAPGRWSLSGLKLEEA